MQLPVAVRRLAFRFAYRVLRVVWFLTRPSKSGVKCLLTDGDLVLLVRHTYGHRVWDLPGGSIKRNEPPLSAARREMSEELGIVDADWVAVGEIHGTLDSRLDTLHCYRAELSKPTIKIDPGELAAASWFRRGELPQDVGPYVARIMARALGSEAH